MALWLNGNELALVRRWSWVRNPTEALFDKRGISEIFLIYNKLSGSYSVKRSEQACAGVNDQYVSKKNAKKILFVTVSQW